MLAPKTLEELNRVWGVAFVVVSVILLAALISAMVHGNARDAMAVVATFGVVLASQLISRRILRRRFPDDPSQDIPH